MTRIGKQAEKQLQPEVRIDAHEIGIRARVIQGDNTVMTSQESVEDLPSDRVVLELRCAGDQGKCRNVQALMLEDGTLHYTAVGCHRLPDDVELRGDVTRRYQEARLKWARARRVGQTFRPLSIGIRPAPRHAREDPQDRENRQQFEAWLAWHDPD